MWKKVREVIKDPDTLAQCVSKALGELEEKRERLGVEVKSIDQDLEQVNAREERLGMAFADGAIKEGVYRTKLGQLKKQESMLLKCRQNMDPAGLAELDDIDERIREMREILGMGRLMVTKFGIFGMLGDRYAPAGFNAFRDTDGKLAIGGMAEQL